MKLLNHTQITKVAKTTLLACSFLMPIAANAASLESTRISYTADRNSLIESDITQQLRAASDTCFKIDKITGQVIPCETKTGGSSGSGDVNDASDSTSGIVPKAFDYFDADQNQSDYEQNPESVITNAYLLSQLSAVSYRNPGYGVDGEGDQAYALAEELGLEHLDVIERSFSSFWDLGGVGGESLAYVFYNDHAVFVVFQGSKGWLDWEESNIDFWPYAKPEWGYDLVSYCFIRCISYQTNVVTLHNGFYDAMDIIFDDVLEAIEPLLQGRKLWITGHSLGGAVSVLTAFRLQHDHNIDVQGVHVFGAPAVGDSDWENAFEAEMSNVHRWGVEGDPAPLATQAPMFYHVGNINNLYEDGDFLLNASASQMLGLSAPCLWAGGPQYGATVRHMSYWPRMHNVFSADNPDLAVLLPDSLPGVDGACE